MNEFVTALEEVKMSKSQLSRDLGVHKTTVMSWHNDPPRYAMAYLEALKAPKPELGESFCVPLSRGYYAEESNGEIRGTAWSASEGRARIMAKQRLEELLEARRFYG